MSELGATTSELKGNRSVSRSICPLDLADGVWNSISA
jgi:hypothetical protein